jgi:hypothetical protein
MGINAVMHPKTQYSNTPLLRSARVSSLYAGEYRFGHSNESSVRISRVIVIPYLMNLLGEEIF